MLSHCFRKRSNGDPHNLRRLSDDGVYHDVPYGEPAAIAMYLQRLERIHPGEMPAIVEAVRDAGFETRMIAKVNETLRAPPALMAAFARHPWSRSARDS